MRLREILEANRKSRSDWNNRHSRLSDVLVSGTSEEFSEAIAYVLEFRKGDELLEPDGEAEPMEGSAGDASG